MPPLFSFSTIHCKILAFAEFKCFLLQPDTSVVDDSNANENTTEYMSFNKDNMPPGDNIKPYTIDSLSLNRSVLLHVLAQQYSHRFREKKKKTGAGKHDWAVAGYDWVYKPFGDSVNVPTSVAGVLVIGSYLFGRAAIINLFGN